MAKSYKALKEEFVSGLTGGSISEINAVTAVAPAAIVLWSALQSRLSFFAPYTPAALFVDLLLNNGAILLATTLYSPNPVLLNALLLGPAVLLYFLPASRPHTKPVKPRSTHHASTSNTSTEPELSRRLHRQPFLTTYRGCMMVITCTAILAVDFRVFPRRFAKVENWGTSLMDLGVGSFVFSAGLIGARSMIKEEIIGVSTPLGRRLYTSARHSTPLLILGLVRLYSVKGLDYAEHVTEYGVHWNFFFTLAFIPPFMALFQSLFALIPSYALLSLLLGTAYQILLDSTTLKAYILVAPRTNLFSQNREGIFSFIGYLSIFLAGQATGMFVLRGPPAQTKPDSALDNLVYPFRSHSSNLSLHLLAYAAMWTALLHLTSEPPHPSLASIPISRRLANLPYILWVNAFNVSQLLAFQLIDRIFFPPSPSPHSSPSINPQKRESRLLASFNRNGLAIFLLANLLTGVVNLSLKTLNMGGLQSMAILACYITALSGVALGLDALGVNIKL